jgi:hypothetical protein
VDQRREALALANEVRMQRAALKAQLKRGELSITSLIDEPPQYLATARISGLLKALPTYGPIKVERLLKACQVAPERPSPASTSVSGASLSRRSASSHPPPARANGGPACRERRLL